MSVLKCQHAQSQCSSLGALVYEDLMAWDPVARGQDCEDKGLQALETQAS